MENLTPQQINEAKSKGFLFDKTTKDKFNGRIITRNGRITAKECEAAAKAAEKFGSGFITMTTRLTMEIQGIPYENIEPVKEFMADYGLEFGGTGALVRPVVSCKGTTCQYGLIDTFSVSNEIHDRFFKDYGDVILPRKFKIAVGGCPNNCVKPDLNDVGIVGQRVPSVDVSKCRGCKVCQIEKNCPIKASQLVNGRVEFNKQICTSCGRCMNKCPFKVYDNYTNGYKIYIGGRWGKQTAKGKYLASVFEDRQEVMKIVEKAILLFKDLGIKGERFSQTVERIGFDKVQELLLSDDLLERKNEILAKPVNEK